MEPIDMVPLSGERVAEALAGLARRNGRTVLEVIRLSLVPEQPPKRRPPLGRVGRTRKSCRGTRPTWNQLRDRRNNPLGTRK